MVQPLVQALIRIFCENLRLFGLKVVLLGSLQNEAVTIKSSCFFFVGG